MHKLVFVAFIPVSLMASLPSQAEVFKCKSPQGKTIYSETPCEGMASQQLEIIDNSLDSSQLRREARTFTGIRSAGPTNTSSAVAEFMSDYDKQKRIEENIVSSKAMSASNEKRADAQYENNLLLKARVRALSYEDNIKRSNLKVDLNQLDVSKRLTAQRELIGLYSNY